MPVPKRPLLCWGDRATAQVPWEPSPGNPTWRPILTHYPDTRLMLPGDILLWQPVKPSLPQKLIRSFQGSNFTHAAVFLGTDHEVCEAVPRLGVALSSLEDSIEKNCLLVRRIPGLSNEDRNRVAIEAGALRRTPYAWLKIVDLASNRYLKLSLKSQDTDGSIRRGVICSSLCEHAILLATSGKVSVRNGLDSIVTPALLAETNLLEDVRVPWTQLVREMAVSSYDG